MIFVAVLPVHHFCLLFLPLYLNYPSQSLTCWIWIPPHHCLVHNHRHHPHCHRPNRPQPLSHIVGFTLLKSNFLRPSPTLLVRSLWRVRRRARRHGGCGSGIRSSVGRHLSFCTVAAGGPRRCSTIASITLSAQIPMSA